MRFVIIAVITLCLTALTESQEDVIIRDDTAKTNKQSEPSEKVAEQSPEVAESKEVSNDRENTGGNIDNGNRPSVDNRPPSEIDPREQANAQEQTNERPIANPIPKSRKAKQRSKQKPENIPKHGEVEDISVLRNAEKEPPKKEATDRPNEPSSQSASEVGTNEPSDPQNENARTVVAAPGEALSIAPGDAFSIVPEKATGNKTEKVGTGREEAEAEASEGPANQSDDRNDDRNVPDPPPSPTTSPPTPLPNRTPPLPSVRASKGSTVNVPGGPSFRLEEGPLPPVLAHANVPPQLSSVPKSVSSRPNRGHPTERVFEDVESVTEQLPSAFISVVNDEYSSALKNLTSAGVLTEDDYKNAHLNDLFALLVEQLLTNNPTDNDEVQRELVHKAALDFRRLFLTKAASANNITEIIRSLNEQILASPETPASATAGAIAPGSRPPPTTADEIQSALSTPGIQAASPVPVATPEIQPATSENQPSTPENQPPPTIAVLQGQPVADITAQSGPLPIQTIPPETQSLERQRGSTLSVETPGPWTLISRGVEDIEPTEPAFVIDSNNSDALDILQNAQNISGVQAAASGEKRNETGADRRLTKVTLSSDSQQSRNESNGNVERITDSEIKAISIDQSDNRTNSPQETAPAKAVDDKVAQDTARNSSATVASESGSNGVPDAASAVENPQVVSNATVPIPDVPTVGNTPSVGLGSSTVSLDIQKEATVQLNTTESIGRETGNDKENDRSTLTTGSDTSLATDGTVSSTDSTPTSSSTEVVADKNSVPEPEPEPNAKNDASTPVSEPEPNGNQSPKPTSLQPRAMLIWAFKINDPEIEWDSELTNKESFQYKTLNGNLVPDLNTIFKKLEPERFMGVEITKFREGIIVEGETELKESVESFQLMENFLKLVHEQENKIGGRLIDPLSVSFDGRPNMGLVKAASNSSFGGTPVWVIGTAVGCALFVAIVITVALIIVRQRRNKRTVRRPTAGGQSTKAASPSHPHGPKMNPKMLAIAPAGYEGIYGTRSDYYPYQSPYAVPMMVPPPLMAPPSYYGPQYQQGHYAGWS